MGFAEENAAKTHCHRGHEFTPENTWVNEKGHRRCKACHKERNKRVRRSAAVGEAVRSQEGTVYGDLLAVYRTKRGSKGERAERVMLRQLKESNPKEFLSQLRMAEADMRAAAAEKGGGSSPGAVTIPAETQHGRCESQLERLIGEWKEKS